VDSAETVKCSTQAEVNLQPVGEQAGASGVGPGGSVLEVRTTPPTYNSSQSSWVNPFLNELNYAENVTANELGGTLGAIVQAQMSLAGIGFAATVSVSHFDAAGLQEPSHRREIKLSGRVLPNGTFDCTRTLPCTYNGKPDFYHESMSYDGDALRIANPESENATEVQGIANCPAALRAEYLEAIQEVFEWCADPFDIPLVSDASWVETSVDSEGNFTVSRMHPRISGGEFAGEVYHLSRRGGVDFLQRHELRDPDGTTWFRTDLGGYFELRSGDWRPRTITSTRFLDPMTGDRRVATSLTIQKATVLDGQAAATVPSEIDWQRNWLVLSF
jgi:hypothetical protein